MVWAVAGIKTSNNIYITYVILTTIDYIKFMNHRIFDNYGLKTRYE